MTKNRLLKRILCVFLMITLFVAMPVTATAASSKVQIVKTTVSEARLRTGPGSSYGVIKTLGKNQRLFYMNSTKNYFCLVMTDRGQTGYVYQGYLSRYGTVLRNQIGVTTKKTRVYNKPNTSSKSHSVPKGLYVVVYQVKNGWCLVKNLSGTTGYIPLSALKRV